MKFSLILATINRTAEVREFIRSLVLQKLPVELIVVDQNTDGRLGPVLAEFESVISIRHILSEPGLSRARNKGIEVATGDLFAFPDDDCLYPTEMLLKVNEFFKIQPNYDGLLIRMKNSLSNGIEVLQNVPSKPVEKMDVFSTASISIFVRRTVIQEIKGFDESMGLGSGSIYKGGEDYDLVFRALQGKKKFYYDKSIQVLHPITNPFERSGENLSQVLIFRQRIQDAGTSDYLLLKRYFPFAKRLKILINNLLGIPFYGMRFNKRQFELHYYRCKGMIRTIRNLGRI